MWPLCSGLVSQYNKPHRKPDIQQYTIRTEGVAHERYHLAGLWIKRRRKALDLTQAALAHRVGCSLDLIQKIEADARRPSRERAARLADMLDLAVDERAPFIQAARRAWRGSARPANPIGCTRRVCART